MQQFKEHELITRKVLVVGKILLHVFQNIADVIATHCRVVAWARSGLERVKEHLDEANPWLIVVREAWR